MLFRRSCFSLCLWLITWHLPGEGKIYPYDISVSLPPLRRAWGGMKTNTGDNFGWLLNIMDGNHTFACWGAYYAPLLVITSANCMYTHRRNLEGYYAEGTAYSKCDKDLSADIDTVEFPKEFVYGKLYMDVAVVLLKTPINGRLTEFIRLCLRNMLIGAPVRAFGWGNDPMDRQVASGSVSPRHERIYTMGMKDCQEWFGEEHKISNSSVCLRRPKNITGCLNDRGSPFVHKNRLCGIVSVSSTCQNNSRPGIYTFINSQVRDFIRITEARVKRRLLTRSRLVDDYPDFPQIRSSIPVADALGTTDDPFLNMVCN